MKKHIHYTDQPIGKIKIVKDFLPASDKLVFKRKSIKEIKVAKSIFEKEMENPKFKAAFEEISVQMGIGERIAELRYKAGMSRLKLAEETGISKAVIARYESGECKSFKIRILVRIARAFHKNLKVSFSS